MSLSRPAFRLRSGVDSPTILTMGQYLMRLLPAKGGQVSLFTVTKHVVVFLFFFLLPTQLAIHFWPTWSYIQGIRVDYLSPTISAVDILSLLIIAFHMRTFVQFIRTTSRVSFIILGLLIGTNLVFSTLPLHSIFSWLRILLGSAVTLIVVRKIQNYLFVILAGLAVGSVIQLLLVCMQFAHQSSLQGVWYWLGERRIVLSLPDVAKISVYGREYLRPYGTFSHPNALGGYYVLLFFFVYWLKQQMPPGKVHALANAILFVCPFIILTSFSKVAILSFVLGSLLLVWGDYANRRCALCLVARTSILTLMFLMFTIPIGDPYSLQKRIVLIVNSAQILVSRPLWGVGLGNYIVAQSSLSVLPRYMPLYQPVHNVFLLIVSEIGFGGLLITYAFMGQMKPLLFRSADLLPVVMTLLITSMSDHYWITQPQTQMLLMFVVFSVLFERLTETGESKKRRI